MASPHIHADGSMCHGDSFSATLEQFWDDYEYAAIAFASIQFVETVNLDDEWGRCIGRWPQSDRSIKKQRKSRKVFV